MTAPTNNLTKEQITKQHKKYLVKAIVKFTEEVGEIEAVSAEEAYALAQKTRRYSLISDAYPGGVYGLAVEELS